VFRWYRQLRNIEDHQHRNSKAREALLEDLDKLEARAKKVVVPLSYADELYALRQHIDLARERLKKG
jgi:hypothetical protein